MQIGSRYSWSFMAVTLVSSVVACGDDESGSGKDAGKHDAGVREDGGDTGGDDGGPATGADAGEGAGDAGGEDGDETIAPQDDAVYAFITQVFGSTPEETVSYVVVTDNLEQDVKIEDAETMVAGRAIGFGPNQGGALFVGGEAAPTITRYDLKKDGSLREGDTVSLQAKGLTSIGEYPGQAYFAAEDKAYFFDGGTAQIVVWNPEDMTLVDDIPLTKLAMTGAVLSFSPVPVVVGDRLFQFAGWRSPSGTTVPSLAGVVVLDMANDDAKVVTDDRCGYVRDGILAEDGFIYMATESFGSSVHRINAENAPAPCLLRFDPEQEAFDETFLVELNELFEGDTAGTLLRGPNNAAYLASLDESATDVTPMTFPRALASATGAWPWASLTLGDDPEVTRLKTKPGNGSVVPQTLGDRVFVPQFVGRTETQMREVTDKGPAGIAFTVPGLVFSAVKLQ